MTASYPLTLRQLARATSSPPASGSPRSATTSASGASGSSTSAGRRAASASAGSATTRCCSPGRCGARSGQRARAQLRGSRLNMRAEIGSSSTAGPREASLAIAVRAARPEDVVVGADRRHHLRRPLLRRLQVPAARVDVAAVDLQGRVHHVGLHARRDQVQHVDAGARSSRRSDSLNATTPALPPRRCVAAGK